MNPRVRRLALAAAVLLLAAGCQKAVPPEPAPEPPGKPVPIQPMRSEEAAP